MARHALAERQVDALGVVDEQANALRAHVLTREHLDVRFEPVETLFDVVLYSIDLHQVEKKVGCEAHLQARPAAAYV
jgi:hypothetical protein